MTSYKKNKYFLGPVTFESKESAEQFKSQLALGGVFKDIDIYHQTDKEKDIWLLEAWDKKPYEDL